MAGTPVRAAEAALADPVAQLWHSPEFEGIQHLPMRPSDVEPLRKELRERNGLHPKLFDPEATEFAKDAAIAFHTNGFCVVKNVIPPERLAALRAAAEQQMDAVLALDHWRGGKGMYTYMFGVQCRRTSMMHHIEWARLCELPIMHQVLEAIFGATNYWCSGGFGVFTLPGAGYQPLHTDGGIVPVKAEVDAHGRVSNILPIDAPERPGYSYVGTSDGCGFFDPRRNLPLPAHAGSSDYRREIRRLTVRDLPVQNVSVGFPVQDMTPLNGPTRVIPGTASSYDPIPSLRDEPQWMKFSTVAPVPAGCAIFRDYRCWHGSTANVSNVRRAHPEVSFAAPYLASSVRLPEMPRSVWRVLKPRAQEVCRYLVADALAATAAEEADQLDTELSPDFRIAFRDDFSLSAEQIQVARSAGYGGSGTQYHPCSRAEFEAAARALWSTPRM